MTDPIQSSEIHRILMNISDDAPLFSIGLGLFSLALVGYKHAARSQFEFTALNLVFFLVGVYSTTLACLGWTIMVTDWTYYHNVFDLPPVILRGSMPFVALVLLGAASHAGLRGATFLTALRIVVEGVGRATFIFVPLLLPCLFITPFIFCLAYLVLPSTVVVLLCPIVCWIVSRACFAFHTNTVSSLGGEELL